MRIARCLALLVCNCPPPRASAATRIDLNRDWAFRTENGRRWRRRLAGPCRFRRARQRSIVPHTWNRAGADYDYLGMGWYFRAPRPAQTTRGRDRAAAFRRHFYKARVWVNGVEMGAHEGGYSAYSFDVSRHLRDATCSPWRSTTGRACSPFRALAHAARPMPGTTGGHMAASCATCGSTCTGRCASTSSSFVRSSRAERATVSDRVTLVSRGAACRRQVTALIEIRLSRCQLAHAAPVT